jgi:hypothetical protein
MKTHPLGFSLRLEFRSCVAQATNRQSGSLRVADDPDGMKVRKLGRTCHRVQE